MTEAKRTIGHIAQAAGVNVETVRYYQRRGLVSLPPKRTRGFRYYTSETASRVRFIKRAQALGMSLKEVQRLINIDAKGACKETRALAVAKLALVESKLVELARLREVLQDLVAACDQPHGTSCPIIERLETELA
ncbi:MAG TPA: MerR family transcriptional regulator [Steroidobacteraceae bacterium]|jgi:MerR family mercuric resistance operon transcriptional regulator|nr:MerR family transcriptional regulator [Steroidobacteraceae bacterium]